MRVLGRGQPFVSLAFLIAAVVAMFPAEPAHAYMHDILYAMTHDMPKSCQNRLWGDVCQTALNDCLGQYMDDPSDRDTTNAKIAACIKEQVDGSDGSRKSAKASRHSDVDEDELFNRCQDTDPDQAIPACTELLQTGTAPTARVTARSFRGMAYVDQKQFTKAEADFTGALRISPTNAMTANILTGRAKAYNGLGQYDRAIADASRALALTTNKKLLPGIYYERGLAYCAAALDRSEKTPDGIVTDKAWPHVLDDMSLALATAWDMGDLAKVTIHRCRGFAYGIAFKPELAISDLDIVLETVPDDAKVLHLRGTLKKLLGQTRHSPTLIADGERDIAASQAIKASTN